MPSSTITNLLTARVADLVTSAIAKACENGDCVLADALLDFQNSVAGGVPDEVVQTFMVLRPLLERVDFMTAFRLRRQLESRYRLEVTAQDGVGTEHLLDLRWRSWPLLIGSAKRAVFESSDCPDPAALLRDSRIRVI